jgi:hypothetical protein
MVADDSLEGAVDSSHDGKDESDFSGEHINPNAIYSFMDHTEKLLDKVQKFDSVGSFYNLLNEAYESMLVCCVLWYTNKWGAQAEQKYLGNFVDILDGFIEGAPELDRLLAEQKDPDLEESERSALDLMYTDYRERLLAAIGERSSGLMAKLVENKEGRYATFYEKLDFLNKALEIEISSQKYSRYVGKFSLS